MDVFPNCSATASLWFFKGRSAWTDEFLRNIVLEEDLA